MTVWGEEVGGKGGRLVAGADTPSLTFARALDVLHGHVIASRRRKRVAQEVACLLSVKTWLAGTLVLFWGEGDDRADGSIAKSTDWTPQQHLCCPASGNSIMFCIHKMSVFVADGNAASRSRHR